MEPQPEAAPAWNRRGTVLIVGTLILVIAVVAYAGPSAPVVIYQLLVDGVFLFAWLLAAAGWGAVALWPLRGAWGDDVPPLSPVPRGEGQGEGPASGSIRTIFNSTSTRSPSPRPSPLSTGERGNGVAAFVTATALGLGVMSLETLGLGLIGGLTRASAFGLVVLGLVCGVVVAWRRWGEALRGDLGVPLRAWLSRRADYHWLWLLALPLLAVALVGATVPPGLLWNPDEPHGYDVVHYHLQVPREWYELGQIVPLQHNVFSYFPFGIEMHYLLAMHLRGGPWDGMYLAQLMHVSFVAVGVLAVYGFASRMAQNRATAIAAALLACAVPWLTLLAPIGYNEGGLLLYGTLAIGWALRGIDATGRTALTRFALAGAMGGFACGVKLTAIPMILLAVPIAVVLASPRSVRSTWVYVLVGAVLFAPWALRNVAWTGNPVFPEAARLLGCAHFSPVQVERWEKAHSPRPDQQSVPGRGKALVKQVINDWRFGYCVPLALGLIAIHFARRDRHMRALVILLVLLLAFWLGLTHLQGRFFVLAVPVAALMVTVANWGRWTPLAAGVAAALTVAAAVWVHRPFYDKLYGDTPLVAALGLRDFSVLNPPDVADVPADATLVLVGEARAFWFQRPIRTLRYRTVFDVDTSAGGGDVVRAWRRETQPNEWVLINPVELGRFADTYWQIPPPPAEWAGRAEPAVLPPGR